MDLQVKFMHRGRYDDEGSDIGLPPQSEFEHLRELGERPVCTSRSPLDLTQIEPGDYASQYFFCPAAKSNARFTATSTSLIL